MIINIKLCFILINIYLIIFNTNFIISFFKNIKKKNFINEIGKIYEAFSKVNINEIDNKIHKNTDLNITKIKSIINIGFTLDNNYVLETMLTVASIMSTQLSTTKIQFHFGVINNFSPENMYKIYELRNKINNLTEFNFYFLNETIIKMKNFHPKGPACPGKFELPIHLSDNIKRLLIFDAGDVLVLRDLTELYNYEMGHYWALGVAEPIIINSFMKVKYNITKYINIGSILLDVQKFKENKFWDYYTKNKNLEITGAPDQTLFNILLNDNNKNYLPFRFGGYILFKKDENFDKFHLIDYGFNDFFNSNLSSTLPENPKSQKGILLNFLNPRFIHQFYGKWAKGEGLSIYRILAKYFILKSGISKELCKKKPGYCL